MDAASYAEDKKCRICGFADMKNVNIFSSNHSKTFLTKILTVYPIVLYPNDPLPKNICKKCIYNVTLMYNDVQRVMKMQSKWINNVRSIQPNHNYIRVLDMIENSNRATRESIRSTLGEEIWKDTINRNFMMGGELDEGTKQNDTAKCKAVATAVVKEKATSSSHNQESKETQGPTSSTEKSTKIKDIKSILELNGCTLVTVKANKQQTRDKVTDSLLKEEFKAPEAPVRKINSSDADEKCTKCRYCDLQFSTLANLAAHQLLHLRISVPKVFEKKYLHKNVRRGRLITVEDRKCIRCLNCWRIFGDNKSILEHWSQGECDFYCQICGEEFPQAPKLLREHVPKVHGINYRSSKIPRERLPIKVMKTTSSEDYKLYQAVTEQEPQPHENTQVEDESVERPQRRPSVGKAPTTPSKPKPSSSQNQKRSEFPVMCNICFKIFQNFKARNSHMRKHKPSFAFGGVVLQPNAVGADNYVKTEPDEVDAPIAGDTNNKTETNPCQDKPAASSSPTTPLTVIRGVRTKFVAPRSQTSNTSIKVKNINDLKNAPAATQGTSTSAAMAPAFVGPSTSTASVDLVTTTLIKAEPMDIVELPRHSEATNEISANAACKIDDYSSSTVLLNYTACEICGLAFATNNDCLVHKMYAHNVNA